METIDDIPDFEELLRSAGVEDDELDEGHAAFLEDQNSQQDKENDDV